MKVYLTNDGFDMRAYDVLESAKPDEAVFSIIRDFFSTNDDINAEECIEKMKEDEDTSSYTLKEMCSLFNEVSEVDYGFIYSIYPEDYAGSGYYMYINAIDDDLRIRVSSNSHEFEPQDLVVRNSKKDPVNGFIAVIKEWAENVKWNYDRFDKEDEDFPKIIDEDCRRIEKIKEYINSGKLKEEYFDPNDGYDPYNIIQLIDIFNKCNPFETFWMDWMTIEYVHNRWGRYTDQCV